MGGDNFPERWESSAGEMSQTAPKPSFPMGGWRCRRVLSAHYKLYPPLSPDIFTSSLLPLPSDPRTPGQRAIIPPLNASCHHPDASDFTAVRFTTTDWSRRSNALMSNPLKGPRWPPRKRAIMENEPQRPQLKGICLWGKLFYFCESSSDAGALVNTCGVTPDQSLNQSHLSVSDWGKQALDLWNERKEGHLQRCDNLWGLQRLWWDSLSTENNLRRQGS